MRFMIMHKMTDEMEKGLPPDPEIIEGVGQLIESGVEGGAFLSGEGLKPSSQRLRLAYEGGRRTVTPGPFSDPHELVAGYALLRVGSRDEAIAWCDKYAAAVGDLELTLGPVVEPWDIGMGERPDDPPQRFLALHQMDERAEREVPPTPAEMAKMSALIEEMTSAGVLEATGGLTSTKRGARVHFEGATHRVIDGPFAESKELIAGYAIMELPSKAAAIEWAVRFGHVVRVHEVEIREVAEG
ncbi:MAG: YciI family protein [Sandaracinaceae bacterium]